MNGSIHRFLAAVTIVTVVALAQLAPTASAHGAGGPRAATPKIGTSSSIVCSAGSRTRHVQLMYLLPPDFQASRGDRSAQVADQMRQALYDASEIVDRRAQELAGQRRRIRVLCDSDGRPTVERAVLPTAGKITDVVNGLGRAGLLPSYPTYQTAYVPSARRVLAYADYGMGAINGEGEYFDRETMIFAGAPASHPMLSITKRGIWNNPPRAQVAVQYAPQWGDTITAPSGEYFLHELSHTMGAVPVGPSTRVGAHCADGDDLMCRVATGANVVCPVSETGVYDCNGDTYFHPAPPAGNPLTGATVWNLASPVNEVLTSQLPTLLAVPTGLTLSGTGTLRTLRWNAVPGATRYEVAYRRAGKAWDYLVVSRASAQPSLAPSTSYDLRVGAIGPGSTLLPSSIVSVRTGRIDTTPPAVPTGLFRRIGAVGFRMPADNVRATRVRVERRVGLRWFGVTSIALPRVPVGTSLSVPVQVRAGTSVRLRALDARGNLSRPSVALRM